jgi:hypothetical protein
MAAARFGYWVAWLFALGCAGPSLDLPQRTEPSWTLELAPEPEPGVVPAVFRGRLRSAPATGEPWLFRGELSDYQEHALRRRELPSSLRDLAVPLRYWREASDCWLQPVAWLEPDAIYSLAFDGIGTLRRLRAVESGDRSARLFPLPGRPKHRVAVMCGDTPVEASLLELQPGRVPLEVTAGMAGVAAPGCVTLTARNEVVSPSVAPPLLGNGLLEPSAWLPDAELVRIIPRCEAGEIVLGACFEIEDDRVLVTPAEDSLWLLTEPTPAALPLRAGRRALLAGGLRPSRPLALRGRVLSPTGEALELRFEATTRSARRHLVINEVLADPAGAEANGEWIEILNDSDAAVSLAGVWLEDGGGHVELPARELRSREHALLVGPRFQATGVDVPVPKDVTVIVLSSLGSRGLANTGEPLLLVGAEGVLSRFPALTARSGHSVARADPGAADDDASAFGPHAEPGASPGAPNQLAAPAP